MRGKPLWKMEENVSKCLGSQNLRAIELGGEGFEIRPGSDGGGLEFTHSVNDEKRRWFSRRGDTYLKKIHLTACGKLRGYAVVQEITWAWRQWRKKMVAAKMEDGDVKGSLGTPENRGEHGT